MSVQEEIKMQQKKSWILVLTLIIAAFALAACGQASTDTTEKNEPASLEAIEGTDLNRITLTARAAERLGIETAVAQAETINGNQRLLIPYSAVIYDINGNTWIYISPEALTYVRQAITVDYIDDNQAILIEGPEEGSEVVTIGVAELYGTDTGVGK
jgi:hypothetical protein